ncbi:T9SS C-terminal target domain-containing protein [Arenibacter sp. N53]|uniref:S8 family serine peptidase n=1 Tax=Arenibacter TaxID=178469 RepID=UPI000CD48AD2|nr:MULTISPECIES: S8 family serine peptidase [Arenibacter]MCM4150138.1 T9SS C-terminal target domain-containing protein [Arenibacter sp. N53]
MSYVPPTSFKIRKWLLLVALGFVANISFAQTEKQIHIIKDKYRSSKLGVFTNDLKSNFTKENNTLLQAAKANGWKLTERLEDGNFSELTSIGDDGAPLYYSTFSTEINNATRANALHDNGLLDLGINGENMLVGVWDAGAVLTNHKEFDNRVQILDQSEIVDSHATRVTGIMVASGLDKKSKGVAYKAKAVSNDWRRDKIEVAEMAANGLLLSNHSYGIMSSRVPDWYFGSYIQVSRDWDKIMYNAPYYLMVTAAGNSQRSKDNEAPIFGSVSNGFDLMLGFATSKNGVTVAAADIETNDQGKLLRASVTSYSSFGPVDDGRIKPDIAAYGTNIYTTGNDNDTSYETANGTSVAAPGVTGSMLLIQEYHEQMEGSFMRAATLKGLVLHSADDVDAPGPDYKMGWGVINSKSAVEVIANIGFSAMISEETLSQGETKSYQLLANGIEPLSASISWTDPATGAVNSGTLNDMSAALVNDLDIKITKDGKTFLPWKLNAAKADAPAVNGDNKVDPFEKIDIQNAKGEYTLTITHKNNLDQGPQNFSIIVTGIALTDCVLSTPDDIELTNSDETGATFNWSANTDALFQVEYKKKGADQWNVETTFDSFIKLQNLVDGMDYSLRVKTYCSENISSEYSNELYFTFKGTETELVDYMEYETLTLEVQFSIFPNPVQTSMTINGDVSEDAMYKIVSLNGTVVRSGKAEQKQIYIADLTAGLYVLTLADLEGSKSIKFYKS